MNATINWSMESEDLEKFMEKNIFAVIGIFLGAAVFIIVLLGGYLLEFLAFILFTYQIKIKKAQYFCTGFFYILMIGYIVDLLSLIMKLLGGISDEEGNFLNRASNVFNWYAALLLGPWNTLMALNRFSAVKYWKTYQIYWNGKYLLAMIILFLIYPFIVNGYALKDFDCIANPNITNCANVINETRTIEVISNGINILIAAFLGFSTAFATRLNLMTVTPETKKFVKHLLIQSFLSTLLFGGNILFIFGVDINKFENLKDDSNLNFIIYDLILFGLAEIYDFWFHISATILLFCVS